MGAGGWRELLPNGVVYSGVVERRRVAGVVVPNVALVSPGEVSWWCGATVHLGLILPHVCRRYRADVEYD